MKKKLETRKSAQFLLSLEGSGGIDSRSEIGTIIDITVWHHRPSVKFHSSCEHVRDNEELIPSHIIITDEHLYILRLTDDRKMMVVKSRRALKTIMRITTKAKLSDVVKIQYGSKGDDKVVHITDSDRLHIPGKADLAIKAIKCCLLPASPQGRPNVAQLTVPHSHLMERRPSMIAEDRRHFTSDKDELSLAKYRRNSSASFYRRRPSPINMDKSDEETTPI